MSMSVKCSTLWAPLWRLVLAVAAVDLCCCAAWAQSTGRKDSEMGRFMDRPAAWFASDEAHRLADNVLSYQSDSGGWPKNANTIDEPYTGERSRLDATFDNGATTGELRFLARVCRATKEPRYREAFSKGLDYILKAQYANGGWPQYHPPHSSPSYQRYITFNDDSMARLMWLVRDVAMKDEYDFVDAVHRKRARDAFNRGIDCILKCQIRVDGKLTAWCAQHDDQDFSPRPARPYELVSLSGCETVGIVRVLMSVEQRSRKVIEAVDAAVAWLESVKLTGIRVERVGGPGDRDRTVKEDPTAPPIWARFYEIGTNRPLFSDRDGVPRYRLADVGMERRSNYNWLDAWPKELLAQEYPAWKARVSQRSPSRKARR